MKKLISMIIASAMIFSGASALLIQSVFAEGMSLPPISGTTRIDAEAGDGVTGGTVVITNTGDSAQSVGDLGALLPSANFFSAEPEAENSGKLDFAMPVDDVPVADPAIPNLNALPEAYTAPVKDDIKEFLITNPINYSGIPKEFTLLKVGVNCLIWVETSNGYQVNEDMANTIAAEFDRSYPTLETNFGSFWDKDGSGKVNVLMYDIQDGNNPAGYIAGFFYAEDFTNANSSQIIHIDTYPSIYRDPNGTARVSNAFSTIVHEMQHMINYSNSANNSKPKMPDWLNEALSMAAEEMIYPNSSIPSRLWTYNADRGGMITNGKSVLDFDNSLESYALSCLFSAYLKSQTDSSVFSSIIDNYAGDAKDAIVKALDGTVLGGLSFGDVLSAYRIALARNDTSGIYGFNSDPALASISQHIYAGNNITLPAGGAITVKPAAGTFSPSGSGTDIKFMGISEETEAPIIRNKPVDMVAGEKHTLTGTGKAPLSWRSSDTAIATIDAATGEINALTVGEATITLANADGATDSFLLKVTSPTISIGRFPASMMVGASTTLEAITRPPNSHVKWTSSNTAFATVDSDGKLTAVAEGTTDITAKIDATTVTATVTVTVVAATTTTYPGVVIDAANKVIDIVEDKGMETLSKIVNTSDANFDIGLVGWTVNLKTPVTLTNHTPIGTSAVTFKGTFNGNNQSITLESIVNGGNAGVFGYNAGTINDMNVTVTGTVGAQGCNNVGAVAGVNHGNIYNSTVNITESGKILGTHSIGGVVGLNRYFLKNSHLTNYGTIATSGTANTGNPSGGIAGQNQGYAAGVRAIIDTATVYNDGIIESLDDVGAVVGLNQTWNDNEALVTGNLDVTIAKNGQVRCASTNSGTASVGGVVGYNLTFGSGNGVGRESETSPLMYIKLRVDGNISTSTGLSGGVIGERGFNMPANLMPYVSVTLGPDSTITGANAGRSGLILSSRDTTGIDKFVYAVPYNSPYHAFPTAVSQVQGVKRIEYPKNGIPYDTIKILDPADGPATNVINANGAANPDGIFIKMDALITPSEKDLEMESAFDDEIFEINTIAQTVQSRYLTEKNYYDFNMLADGIPIVVPAYLDVKGKLPPPEMTLDITGDKVKLTEPETTADPGYGKQEITITARNGRITSWDITKEGVSCLGSISMSQNTDLIKRFSVSDTGLYVITANGIPLGATVPPATPLTKTKYLRIGGIPAITIVGQHLTGLQTETWTNLKDSQPTALTELATAEAHATTIEELTVTKGAVPYQLYPGDYVTAADITAPAKRSFKLMETGRYVLTAKGVGLPIPAVKYVNIDVDRPMPPIVDLTKARAADIPITLPTESVDQSPIHAEYKVDDGAFAPVMGGSVPLQGKKITLRTVDLAGNISDEIIIQLCTVTVTPEPANGGTVTGGGSYLLVGRNVNGTITYDRDTFATIKATPASGYKFDKWTDGTGEYNTAEYVFKVVGDVDFVAHFSGLPIDPPAPPASSEPSIPPDPILPGVVTPTEDYVKLEYIPKEGGTVEGKSPQYIRRYTDGESVTAKPKPSYRFVTWSDGVKTATRKDLRVANDITVYALFELIPQEKPIAPPNVVRPPKTGSINWTPLLVTAMLSSLGTLIFCSTKLIYVRKKCS